MNNIIAPNLKTYFILDDDIKKMYMNSSMDRLEIAFISACEAGHIEKVKYLLTSKDLEKNVYIHISNHQGLKLACQRGNVQVVKYLLTSPDLDRHAYIHVDEDEPFKKAVFHEQKEVINYLIFEYDIPKTKAIEKYLKNANPNQDKILNFFDKHELQKKLNSQLVENTTKTLKNKI